MIEQNGAAFDFPARSQADRHFLICSVPRSGSTLLCRGLWATGQAGAPKEYFHRKHMAEFRERWGFQTLEEYIQVLETHRTSPNGYFGAKIHFDQFVEQFGSKLPQEFFPDPRMIYVTRRDHVRQAISLSRAVQSRRWSSADKAQAEAVYSHADIRQKLQFIRDQEAGWEKFFQAQGVDVLHIEYETLANDFQHTVSKALAFLDVPGWEEIKIGKPETKRLADDQTEEWVQRFQDDSAGNPVLPVTRSTHEPPRISVEMGCYNFAPYLRQALDSVLAQTLQPFEIIISDDCSTDGSWDIIQEYRDRHPELIRAFQTDRNRGMKWCGIRRKEMMRGELFSTIDGDDRWLPDKLQVEYEALRSHPDAKIAYSNVNLIDREGKVTGTYYSGQGPKPPSGDVFIQTFSKQFFPNTRALFRNHLMYTDVLHEIGFKDFSEELMHPDWDKKIRMTHRYPVIYSGSTQVEYRIHEGGIHRSGKDRIQRSIQFVYEKNCGLLKDRSLAEALYVARSIQELKDRLKSSTGAEPGHVFSGFTPSLAIPMERGETHFLMNSLPKSGTYLLRKLLQLLGLEATPHHISRQLAAFRMNGTPLLKTIPAGVDWPTPIAPEAVRAQLLGLEAGQFATAHMPFSRNFDAVLRHLNTRSTLILRDPRDVVVSHARYVSREPGHFLYPLYQTLSPAEQLMASIIGLKASRHSQPQLLDIRKRWESVLPWLDQEYNYTTTFEKLVGEQGGGDQESQIIEITNIASHYGLTLDEGQIHSIADNLFGGTTTFRKGKIGKWREHFLPEHKAAFKELAGPILVSLGYEADNDW